MLRFGYRKVYAPLDPKLNPYQDEIDRTIRFEEGEGRKYHLPSESFFITYQKYLENVKADKTA